MTGYLSTKQQRAKEIMFILNTTKSLSMSEIKKICGYSQNNSAIELAESIEFAFPDRYKIIKTGTGRTSSKKLCLLSK